MTLVEQLSKLILPLQSAGRTAQAVTQAMSDWLSHLPQGLVRSITLDNRKAFSNWKSLCNHHD